MPAFSSTAYTARLAWYCMKYSYALQQQGDAHPAPRRAHQRALQLHAGDEIGVGDQDLALGQPDRDPVVALDAAPKAHVVAQHQGGQRTPPPAASAGVRRRPHAFVGHVGAGFGGLDDRLQGRPRGRDGVASRPTCRRAQSRTMVSRMSTTSGPLTRTEKSKRGWSSVPWFGS